MAIIKFAVPIITNKALVKVIKQALSECGFDEGAVELITSTDRESANALMSMRGLVDVLIPRGGKGLINACVQNSKVPVIETGAGNCHLYVDASADIEKAFAKFKEFSNIKKKQVNDGLLSHNGYYEWCIEQRNIIDQIMMNHNLFDRG